LHNLDASVKSDYEAMRSHYFQAIAYSSFDKVIYGIDSTDLVKFVDGKPTKVAALEGPLYTREPNAIGAAPAVIAVIPVASSSLVVVPKVGSPMLYREGKVTRLSMP